MPLRALLRPEAPAGSDGRQPSLRILFAHSNVSEVACCLHELDKVHFTVSSKTVATPEEFANELKVGAYDLVIAEYPAKNWKNRQALELLDKSSRKIPLIIVGRNLEPEAVAGFITKGAYYCIEMDHIGHLPVAIRRALDERALRAERDRAEKGLRHSEARYRALAGNSSYGICYCSVDGRFLEVNEAMLKMLGYESTQELLSINLVGDLIQDRRKKARLMGEQDAEGLVDPLEIECKRKDGTILKIRLSGQKVTRENGESDTFEVIAEDVTKQRELENHLRQQAAHDPLTGLANYRQLAEVLATEIKRSERTNREFALLLFDMDDLKEINDRYGHTTGSQALCRVADVLSLCRDIDTAARYGGDEFAVVLPETGAEAANRAAERICDRISNDRLGPRISVSMGVAVYPRDGKKMEDLLRVADVAMYAMKARRHKPPPGAK